MLVKFKDLTDDLLAIEVKKGTQDAELELIERYKKRALYLSARFYSQFKSNINCDVEDLYNVALLAVITASKTFSKTNGFRSYWSEIARNEVMEVIKKCSRNVGKVVCSLNECILVEDEGIQVFSENDTTKNLLYDELVNFINSKVKAPKLDKELFLQNIMGYDYNDLAELYNLDYQMVRYKIEKIRTIIKKKLQSF